MQSEAIPQDIFFKTSDPDLSKPSCSPRLKIGEFYFSQPVWKRALAVPFIYVPIASTIPSTIVGNLMLRAALKLRGVEKLNRYMDYLPAWASHRYTMKTQIVMESKLKWSPFMAIELAKGVPAFWIFNCKMYCPMSVALYRQTTHFLEEAQKSQNMPPWLEDLLLAGPLLMLTPSNIIGNALLRIHLNMLGAANLDEVNRYDIENAPEGAANSLKSYCLKLIGSSTKLIEIVETWWCPFNHEAKESYAGIDHSSWGVIAREKAKLHPDDRENPIWENGEKIVDTRLEQNATVTPIQRAAQWWRRRP